MKYLPIRAMVMMIVSMTMGCTVLKPHDGDLRQALSQHDKHVSNREKTTQLAEGNMNPMTVLEIDPSLLDSQRPDIQPNFYAYVGGGSEQIGVYRFDPVIGMLTLIETVPTPEASPTFLAIHPKRRWLYAANESATGGLIAFAIDRKSGQLTQLAEAAMNGFGPTHVSIDSSGQWVMAAGYNSGRIASYPILSDGRLETAVSDLFAGQNAHQILSAPSGSAVFVPCLGSNYIAQYKIDTKTGILQAQVPASLATGTGGPRHMAFHPNGQWAYVLNELASTVQALRFNTRTLQLARLEKPVSTLASPVRGNSGAEVQVHPSGKFVYTSNRGDDSIALFSVNADGSLTFQNTTKTGGEAPRHFSIDPTGKWLLIANQNSNSLTIMTIDHATGFISLTNKTAPFDSPQFIEVVDLGTF